MHTREELMAKATGNSPEDRKAIVNLLRCYGMSTAEAFRLMPGEERVNKILQLQEEKGYISFRPPPPVQNQLKPRKQKAAKKQGQCVRPRDNVDVMLDKLFVGLLD